MILDMSLVTFALLGVLLLFAILSRIWRDQTMGIPQADEKDTCELASQSAAIDDVAEKENTLT